MDIGPGRIINDFIEPNRRQYVIPVYQRNYEWSEDDCRKLFEDIINAYRRGALHFCGSVVFAPLNIGLDLQTYVIIDGQQRLTTIYLLLKALLDTAESDYDKDFIIEAITNTKKQDAFTVTEATKLKLKPVRSDNKQLLLLMDNKLDEIDKSSGIWRNYELFCNLIKKAMSEDEDLRIKNIYNGVDRLTCARIQLGNDDNAQEIFERINSTGVPLSLADKIRNYVLMTDEDQERLFEDYWLNIEKLIKKDYRSDFFYSYLNLKLDEFAKEKVAYEQFKDLFVAGGYSNEGMLSELLHYAELYNSFMYGSSKYSDETNELLRNLQSLNQTTVFLFLYSIFDDYLGGKLQEAELIKVLKLLVTYSIRRTICEVNSASLRGLYKTLYTRVFNNENHKNHYYDAIVSFLQQLTSKDEMPGDRDFKEALKYNNLYKKNALCRFLLTSIENQGKEKILTDNLTIEHILPQNKNLSPVWQTMLGPNWEDVRNKYLHTLGNLTLTAHNSEFGDRPFAEKQRLLDEFKTKAVVLYEDVQGLTEWNEDTIKARAERLSEMIVNMYPVEKPATVISFSDPRYKEYSCDDPNAATYKTPNYFILDGERVKVSSFAELQRKLIDRLYERDKTVIEQMARNDERLLDWSECVMFSYDCNKTWGANVKVSGSDIYRSNGFSASHIMHNVAALLDRYDLDYSDFSYSAKDTDSSSNKMRLSKVIGVWAANKDAEGMIHYDAEHSNMNYHRFTRDVISEIIPDSDKAASGWKTKNNYFYEIVNEKGSALYIKLEINSTNATPEQMEVFSSINTSLQKFPDKKWIWRSYFSTHKEPITDEMEDESILKVLDAMFDELMDLEKDFLSKIERA